MLYITSIVSKYGDTDNVRADIKTLTEILARQGVSLLIDVIAEYIGDVANKFKLSGSERSKAMTATIDELESAIKERI